MSGFSHPPFGGHHNFSRHWLPEQFSIPPEDSPHRPYQVNHFSSQPMFAINGANFSPNGQIPGLSTIDTGILPTPPRVPMPNIISTPYYSPNTHAQTSGAPVNLATFPSPMNQSQSNGGYSKHPNTSEQIMDQEQSTGLERNESPDAMDLDSREEGELSNGETEIEMDSGAQTTNDQKQTPLVDYNPEVPHLSSQNKRSGGQAAYRLGHNAASAQTDVRTHSDFPNEALGDQISLNDTNPTNGSRLHVPIGRSLAQLRMQAQGALLNLAPHNIRYKELVNEGVDPTILKNLYEGIGLKVAAGEHNDPPATNTNKLVGPQSPKMASASGRDISDSQGKLSPTTQPELPRVQPTSTPIAPLEKPPKIAAPLKSSTTTVDKPLERKDLIARMLAAKAGKSVVTQQQETPAAVVNNSLDSSREKHAPPETTVPMAERPQPASEEARVREKSKAQTELARQRIEQLKKKGLSKSQSQSVTDSASGSPLAAAVTSVNNMPIQVTTPQDARAFQPVPLKHPLPERPPVPEVAVSRIPGLFMTGAESVGPETPATTNSRQIAILGASSSVVRISRKRPRASDFTDDIAEEPSHKQLDQDTQTLNSDHRVIIDISEDESMYDADVNVDESVVNGQTGGKPAAAESSVPKSMAIQDTPPLSDIHARPMQSYRSASSGSLARTPSKGRDEENIRSEIMIMRQRIAELERRRDAKRAAQAQPISTLTQPALSATVVTPSVFQEEEQTLNSEQPQTTAENAGYSLSTDNQSAIGAIETDIPLNSARTAHTAGSSTRSWSSLEPKKVQELRQKFLRKREIESGLPLLEARLSESEAKLAHHREEERKLLAEIAKGKAGKRSLIEELEELGVETEGLTLDELQLTKNRLEAEIEMREQTPAPAQINQDVPNVVEVSSRSETILQDGNVPDSGPSPLPIRLAEESCVPDVPTVPSQVPSSESTIALHREGTIMSSRSSSAMDESMGSNTDDQEVIDGGERLPFPSISEDNSSASVSQPICPVQDIKAPAEDVLMHGAIILSHSENIKTDIVSSREQSVISDAYEPPEPDAATESGSLATPPFSPAPADSIHSVDIGLDSTPLTQEVEPLTLVTQTFPKTAIMTRVEDEADETGHHFTPYISPLRLFKAYRYHPNFVNDIEGGFRSLTYSHNIDPDRPLCAFEFAGGVCNDQSCQNQHFRDMILSDDKILVEMGSLREGTTPAEREEYVTGLKQIINDMRRDRVKDFNTVATEIAAYRRRFLQDPSRVLAL